MFKIGDKVRLIKDGFRFKKGSRFEVVEEIKGIYWIVEGKCTLSINKSWNCDYFELVQEEQPMKLKQNWSISVHSKEQAEVYEKTLIALGYGLTTTIQKEWTPSTKSLYHSDRQQDYFWYSGHISALGEDRHFENLESFLTWHFQEGETEQQKRLKELEETIARAQHQIEQLKNGL